MIVRKAFKFKLKPRSEQRLKMAQTAGCVRLVWNRSLAAVKQSLDQKEGYKGYCHMAGAMKLWKAEEETSFLKLVHSQPLQQTLKDLDRAIRDGFKKNKGFPHFKKKSRDKSFRYPQGVKIDGDQVYLPKIGHVKFQASREIQGVLKNTTVSFSCGHWYVSFQTEFEQEVPVHPLSHRGGEIGVDVGVVHFATLSDQSTLESPRPLKKYAKKLAKAQKELARKKLGSNHWQKQKYRVQRLHKKIADIRRDFLHKASSKICQNHAKIVIEDLNIVNMTASAKGAVDEPGKNVKAKSGLNKAILDQGWFEFKRQLGYKSAWLGGELILVPARNTSLRCSVCGAVSRENRKTQANFACVSCGYQDNADANAAVNILAAGRAVIACGDIRPVAV